MRRPGTDSARRFTRCRLRVAVVLAASSATKYSVLDGGLTASYAVGLWLAVALLASDAVVTTATVLGTWSWRSTPTRMTTPASAPQPARDAATRGASPALRVRAGALMPR